MLTRRLKRLAHQGRRRPPQPVRQVAIARTLIRQQGKVGGRGSAADGATVSAGRLAKIGDPTIYAREEPLLAVLAAIAVDVLGPRDALADVDEEAPTQIGALAEISRRHLGEVI